MASPSYTLSLPLQLPRYASAARLVPGAPISYQRPSPSVGRPQTTTKGLRSVAATSSYHQHEAQAAGAGHGDNGGIAATTSALHLVAGDDDAAAAELMMRAAARLRAGGAPRSPKGRPGAPREGSGGKVHAAAPPTLLRRLPKEGAGGQGGSIH